MTDETQQKYTMTTSLNVLNHLGIGLYSNVPAVLSEAVANAWDADATCVNITIDVEKGVIEIRDDGHGMTVDDVNAKYLHVGYERRKDSEAKTPNGRLVMGRKGIGKLSLFSIANTVTVQTNKDEQIHGFIMTNGGLNEATRDGGNKDYHPVPIDPKCIDLDRGTRIVLTDMKRRLNQTGSPLKRRLARRFSVIGSNYNFTVSLNNEPVTIQDRGYHTKIQYIWTFGELGKEVASIASNAVYKKELQCKIETVAGGPDQEIDGWLGTVKKPGDLRDSGYW